MKRNATDLKRLTALSLLAALVAVLACLGNFIKIGPFPVTLTLTPIIVGAALYGPSAGAVLGGVFGLVTMITGFLCWDGGAYMMLVNASAFWAVAVCLFKGIAAGWCAGLVYRGVSAVISGRTGSGSAGRGIFGKAGAVVLAGIACPVVNTGIFLVFMLTVFRSTLSEWAGGSDVLVYAITGLTGINFLIELTVNMLLASTVTTIIHYALHRK